MPSLFANALKIVRSQHFRPFKRVLMSRDWSAYGHASARNLNRRIELREPFIEPFRKADIAVVKKRMNIFVGRHSSHAFVRMQHDVLAFPARMIETTNRSSGGVAAKLGTGSEQEHA